MTNEMMQKIKQKVLESMPEDSPLRQHIEGDGSDALVAVLVAMFFLPTEEIKRISSEVMQEMEATNDNA